MSEYYLMQNGITKGGARKLTKCVKALLNRSQVLDEIISTLDEADDSIDTRKLLCDLEVGLKNTYIEYVGIIYFSQGHC